jgi:hypothetical protein
MGVVGFATLLYVLRTNTGEPAFDGVFTEKDNFVV